MPQFKIEATSATLNKTVSNTHENFPSPAEFADERAAISNGHWYAKTISNAKHEEVTDWVHKVTEI